MLADSLLADHTRILGEIRVSDIIKSDTEKKDEAAGNRGVRTRDPPIPREDALQCASDQARGPLKSLARPPLQQRPS